MKKYSKLVIFSAFAIAILTIITIFYTVIAPFFQWRKIDQFNNGWERTELDQMVRAFNAHDFDQIILRIQDLDPSEMQRVEFYTKSQIVTVEHAVAWQNSIPAMINNFLLLTLVLVCIEISYKGVLPPTSQVDLLKRTKTIKMIIVCGLCISILGLTIFSNVRRQIIQNHAGAYTYILAVIQNQ